MDDRLVAIESFCGAGGLSLGLSHAGFHVAAAFDHDADAVTTYRDNLGDHVFQADICQVTGSMLRERANLTPGEEVALFTGGPPCQGFSTQTRGAHYGDRRNRLVLEYLRLVHELQPRAFIMENVAQLAHTRGTAFVDEFKRQLDAGYVLTGHFYTAADYGVAQTRERFILVGIREDQPGGFHIPKPTTPHWLTVGQVIGDLPEPPADYTVHPRYPNHQAARVQPLNIERFSHVPQGGGWRHIPEHLRLECHKQVNPTKGGWPDVYGRLKMDGQCPTITAGFDSFTRGRYGHPTANRPLTPREAARLQGFPDWFRFHGTRHAVRHQIGNAVPVTLGQAIAGAVKDALIGVTARIDPLRLF